MGTGPHMGTSHFFSVVTFKMRHTKKGKKKIKKDNKFYNFQEFFHVYFFL